MTGLARGFGWSLLAALFWIVVLSWHDSLAATAEGAATALLVLVVAAAVLGFAVVLRRRWDLPGR